MAFALFSLIAITGVAWLLFAAVSKEASMARTEAELERLSNAATSAVELAAAMLSRDPAWMGAPSADVPGLGGGAAGGTGSCSIAVKRLPARRAGSAPEFQVTACATDGNLTCSVEEVFSLAPDGQVRNVKSLKVHSSFSRAKAH